jgi:hypothetical protein
MMLSNSAGSRQAQGRLCRGPPPGQRVASVEWGCRAGHRSNRRYQDNSYHSGRLLRPAPPEWTPLAGGDNLDRALGRRAQFVFALQPRQLFIIRGTAR